MKISATLCALLISCALATGAHAMFDGPDKTKNPVTTTKEASSAKEDTFVLIEGNILEQVGDELYMFEDSSGTIYVEIDDEIWPYDLIITPEILVEIQGSVDKDSKKSDATIEADRVSVKKMK